MDPLLMSLGCFILLLGLIILGVPIAFAGSIAGVAGLLTIGGLDMTLHFLSTIPYSEVASYSYITLPLYILLGEFAYFGGYAHGAYRTAKEWLGHLPGGIAVATVIGGAGFGAVCGASVASAAVLGKICIPEMKKLGYSDALSTGSVAASANLASMIPPSGLMIVYSIFTEQSINQLFIAGIVPGILITLLLAATVWVRVSLNPSLAPNASSSSWGKRLKTLMGYPFDCDNCFWRYLYRDFYSDGSRSCRSVCSLSNGFVFEIHDMA